MHVNGTDFFFWFNTRNEVFAGLATNPFADMKAGTLILVIHKKQQSTHQLLYWAILSIIITSKRCKLLVSWLYGIVENEYTIMKILENKFGYSKVVIIPKRNILSFLSIFMVFFKCYLCNMFWNWVYRNSKELKWESNNHFWF